MRSARGGGSRTLNVVDDYTRECLAIEVDTSLGGLRVVRVLEELKARRGLPRQIRSMPCYREVAKPLKFHALSSNEHLQRTIFRKLFSVE